MGVSRRGFLKGVASIGVLAAVGSGGRGHCAEIKSGGHPNILFIAIDDLNDWVRCLSGHPQALTPNIDHLAERGVLFTNAHCNAPVCNASRCALWTGLAPWTTGVYHNEQDWRAATEGMPNLPLWLRERGYYTASVGKAHHHLYGQDGGEWDECHDVVKDIWPGERLRGWDPPPPAVWDWGGIDRPLDDFPDWQHAQIASEIIGRGWSQPWFLVVGFKRPHMPLFSPMEFRDAFSGPVCFPPGAEDILVDIPQIAQGWIDPEGIFASVVKHGGWPNLVRGYLTATYWVDYCIGSVLDALENSGQQGNTVVVLWSDHGYHLGEKGHIGKWALWERTTRVPIIISAPDFEVGTYKGAISSLDIAPTLCDLAGVQRMPNGDGESLVRVLADTGTTWSRPVVTARGHGNYSIRSMNWRYTKYADGTEELYCHHRWHSIFPYDPHEWTNVADDPEAQEIKDRWAEYLPEEG